MNMAINCPEIRSANLQENITPREEFEACDAFLRSYEQQVTNWPAVAQACLRVKQGELWKHGGYHSWHDWINKAAPVSARTVFYHTGLFESLVTDFTPEELAAMPPETAKIMRQLSTSARRDPKIRALGSCKRKKFVETVKIIHPEQMVEDVSMWAFSLTDSQREVIEEEFKQWRDGDPNISDAEILVALCINSRQDRQK